MKKVYTAPKLTRIGDMINNTLGASGTAADNGTYQQGGANGNQANSSKNSSNKKSTKFSNDSFSNDSFKR